MKAGISACGWVGYECVKLKIKNEKKKAHETVWYVTVLALQHG